MLILDKGLRIRFWKFRNQGIEPEKNEGIIQFKTSLTQNSYIVDVVESGCCIVHYNQITHVLIKDFNNNDIWVNIDDLYPVFTDGTIISWDTMYNRNSPISFKQLRTKSLKYGINDVYGAKTATRFTPKKVIFNDPATIVIWNDGTKTIVKRREGEIDDKEKAVMYCILKKMCGSKSNMDKYLKTFLEEA